MGLFVTREIQLGSDNVIVIALLLQRMHTRRRLTAVFSRADLYQGSKLGRYTRYAQNTIVIGTIRTFSRDHTCHHR